MLVNDHDSEEAKEFAAALAAYLNTTLHQAVDLSDWTQHSRLPSFLSRRYKFYTGVIANRPCLFMTSLEQTGKPAELAKHVNLASGAFNGIVVYATAHMSADRRARLISHGVAFIVPGNQLYIPHLAMDLRDYFRTPRKSQTGHLSPAAQAVVFHHVLRKDPHLITPSGLAPALGYSAMTIGRAFEELRSIGIAVVHQDGRTRSLSYRTERREILKSIRELLRSPVVATHYIRGPVAGSFQRAGETALADLTGLAPPDLHVYATSTHSWKTAINAGIVERVQSEEIADGVVETWRYDPHVLSDSSVVDVLSLYAQFWDHRDERVAHAASELLEAIDW